MSRISGKSFDVRMMGIKIHVESYTLSITDNSAVAKNGGIPHGYVEGDVEASGEIVVDAANLMLISAAAQAAGSSWSAAGFSLAPLQRGQTVFPR